MGYDEIIAFAPLALYAQNRDLAAQLPGMVARAQKYIVSGLDHDAFMTELAPTTIDADGVLDETGFPAALLELRSVSIEIGAGRYMPLRPRDYEMLTALFSDRPHGRPKFYAQDPAGGHRVFPAPGRVIPARVRANVEPDPLAPGTQENAISLRFPRLLQLATTREAAVFMLDAQMVELYETETGNALRAANAQVGRRTRDEASQRPVDTRNVQGA